MILSSNQKRLMIAAPASGSGKTVLTLALLRALKDRGIDIAGAKAGPDYIDPAFHAVAAGRPSVNLDPWAMTDERLASLAGAQGADYLLAEAMMGLFDGAADGSGSAADLAVSLAMPVLLVVDAAKQSHSIAALVEGFARHRKDTDVAGVLLNKIGSDRHEALLREALKPLGLPVVGAVKRSDGLALPERHLGLVQARERTDIEGFIANAAQTIAQSCDMELLVSLFQPGGDRSLDGQADSGRLPPPGQKTAVAQDEAFAFCYPHMLADWRARGSEISFFSPLGDEAPAAGADAVFLPGGYPELHAGKLAAAGQFKAGMAAAAERGALIYGECGGYMVLGESLIDAAGKAHAMLGLLPLVTSFERRKLHLGYRRISAQGDFVFGKMLRGHEFHYTRAVREAGEPLFSARDALGADLGSCGLRNANVMGSYLHVIDAEENA